MNNTTHINIATEALKKQMGVLRSELLTRFTTKVNCVHIDRTETNSRVAPVGYQVDAARRGGQRDVGEERGVPLQAIY